MPSRTQQPKEERQLLTRLRKFLSQPLGLAHGSLVFMQRKCGTPNCRCTRGELHGSWYLSTWEEGRTRMVYIPKAWEERVREWVERDKEIRAILLELSRVCVDRLRNREE
jgi:hypothetical protein